MRTFLCLVLLCVPSLAQESFRVEGEQTVTVKSPFRVHAEKPGIKFDLYDWDRSFQVQFKPGPPGVQEVTAPNGKHSISCIAYKIDWEQQKVIPHNFFLEFVVGTVKPDPDPDPDPDDGDMSGN